MRTVLVRAAVGASVAGLRDFSNGAGGKRQIRARYPNAELLRGTPALALVDAAAHLDPLHQPRALLADPAPAMAPRWPLVRTPPGPRLARAPEETR